MTYPQLILRGDDREAEEERLARYKNLEDDFALPIVSIVNLAEETRVTFGDVPPPVQDWTPDRAARAIAWLAALERRWGAALGCAFGRDEVRYDAARSCFVVGPGLIRPFGAPVALDVLGSRATRELQTFDVEGFDQLVAVLERRHPELQGLLAHAADENERIRALGELARSHTEVGRTAEALKARRWAWEIRPGDVSLAERVAGAALAAGALEGLDDVLEVLLAHARRRASSALLLGEWWSQRGEPGEAAVHLERAAQLEPDDRRVWTRLMKVRRQLGDEEGTVEAVQQLARLGVPGAVHALHGHDPKRAYAALDAWPGTLPPELIPLRLGQLYQEERLRAFMALFVDSLDALADLDDAGCEQVLGVAERLREEGSMLRLRRALYERVVRADGPRGLTRIYASACLAEELTAQLVELEAHHPGVLPKALWLRCLRAERRHRDVLERADLDAPQEALECFRCLVQLALDGEVLEERLWAEVVQACAAQGETLAACRAEVEPLLAALPRLRWLQQVAALVDERRKST